jgi:hypothetical protein
VTVSDEVFIYCDRPRITGRASKRQLAYWLLDQTLKSGDFSQVRRCRSCPKYFATTRIDRVSCGPECNVKYQNQQRQRSDNGQLDYFTQKRWEQREKKFNRALELKQEGRSPAEIQRTTGLSDRVFRKEQRDRGLVALLKLAKQKDQITPPK